MSLTFSGYSWLQVLLDDQNLVSSEACLEWTVPRAVPLFPCLLCNGEFTTPRGSGKVYLSLLEWGDLEVRTLRAAEATESYVHGGILLHDS